MDVECRHSISRCPLVPGRIGVEFMASVAKRPGWVFLFIVSLSLELL
jgi:hypothetical protein